MGDEFGKVMNQESGGNSSLDLTPESTQDSTLDFGLDYLTDSKAVSSLAVI
jgi:hypothetical protein